ncbi:MAG: GNAT family N-acetyltransferase [Salinirussus sp.]
MEFEVLGWPPDAPAIDLDHECFAYAGKFVMTGTGKAVARSNREIVAAAAFSADRTDERTLRCRYITVRDDMQANGFGSRLLRFVADRGNERGFTDVLIAVNNPYAYVAAYRAGFAFTGEETGLAEVVLADGSPRDDQPYRDGLRSFLRSDMPDDAHAFVKRKLTDGVPKRVDLADSED